ncbi:MAG: hypothetical protein ACOCWI_01225, partial [Bacillota bacterium]
MATKKAFIVLTILLFIVTALFFFANSSEHSAQAVIDEDFSSQYNNNTVFEIDDIEDWKRIKEHIEAYDFLDKTIILNCDLDLKLYPGSLDNFRGTFEGNHHKVINITKPFINEIKSQGVLKDLYFYNADITSHNAVVATYNMGTIDNVSAHGTISYADGKGLVYLNNGTIKDSISYLKIIDTSTSIKSFVSGVAGVNTGQIVNSHFMGSITGTNNSVIGGLTAQNQGAIEKSSARFNLIINIIKSNNNLVAGGLVGDNGYSFDYEGEIANSFAVIDVEYITENPIPTSLSVSGLIGNSINTDMQNCYSDIKGQGTLYGIISRSEAEPVYEDPEIEDVIVDYILTGTDSIDNCF